MPVSVAPVKPGFATADVFEELGFGDVLEVVGGFEIFGVDFAFEVGGRVLHVGGGFGEGERGDGGEGCGRTNP